MNPFVAIVDNSLMEETWATNKADCPVYKAKTVVQGSSFVCDSISIHLHAVGVQNVIPLSDSRTVLLEDKVNNLIAYWSAKSAHQIAKSAWVGKSLQ